MYEAVTVGEAPRSLHAGVLHVTRTRGLLRDLALKHIGIKAATPRLLKGGTGAKKVVILVGLRFEVPGAPAGSLDCGNVELL